MDLSVELVEPRNRHARRAAAARKRQKYGWRVQEWSDAVGCSRAYTYQLIAAESIDTVKLGRNRIIRTHPEDFLASLAAEAV